MSGCGVVRGTSSSALVRTGSRLRQVWDCCFQAHCRHSASSDTAELQVAWVVMV